MVIKVKNKNLFFRRVIAGIILLFSFFIAFVIINNETLGSTVWCQGDEWTCEYCCTQDPPNITAADNGETIMVGAVAEENVGTDCCAHYFKIYYSSGVFIYNESTDYCGSSVSDADYSVSGLYPGTTYTFKAKACQTGCESCTYDGNHCTEQSDECSDFSGTASDATDFNVPTSLSADCAYTSADLTWNDNSNAETGYKVEKKAYGGSYSVFSTIAANSETEVVDGLTENDTYYFRVRAYHSSGSYSSYSNEATCNTSLTPPNSMTATASATSSIQINLTWNDRSAAADGYKIERATGVCSGFVQIAIVADGNAETYSDTGLSHGTTYCYRVRAYEGAANSTYSGDASATTIMPAPSNLSGSAVSQTEVDLIWSDNSNSETGFKIERADNSDCSGTPSFSQIATTTSNAVSYANTGLTSDTSYCYRIRAYTSYTTSSYSSTTSVATSLPSPTNLAATVSATSTTQINLTWTDNSDNEDEFRLERKTGSSGTYAQIVSVATNTTAYANTGVSDGTVYYYRARACNSLACSSYSAEAHATTTLAAPTSLTCTPINSSQINLGWSDNSISETGFKIERATSSPPTTVIATTAQNATSYNDGDLYENTTYYYRVRAYNANSGVYSDYTSICSTSTPIYVPTGNMTSSIFDTGFTNGVAFNNILWKGTQPSGSSVLFHFASSNSTSSLNLVGPDGTAATYYQAAGSDTAMEISTRYHNNHRYFRYKVYIYPNESNQSPQITDVIIGYSP